MNKILNSKSIAVISIAVAGLFVSFAFLQEDRVDAEIFVEQNGIAKAVIIDQLSDEIPNEFFQQKATGYLEEAGYKVDIITTKDITVDFYKNLPKMNYDYVVIRTHGATDDTNSDVVLFTGEKYTESKYTIEQLSGYVKRATPLLELSFQVLSSEESKWVQVNDTYKVLRTTAKPVDNSKNEFFAISSKLVDEQMVGKFQDTIFLLGGCSTLANPSMAEALVKRGASTVVGWSDTIGAWDNDMILLQLLEETLINEMKIDNAVELIMQKNDFMRDRVYNGILTSYSLS